MTFMRSVFLLMAGRRAGQPQVYAAGHHTDITRGAVLGRGPVPAAARKAQVACWATGAAWRRHVMPV
jgi:hypothetical protein